MKKILFAMVALFATAFVSCDNGTTTSSTSNDSIDTLVQVDSLDSVAVDSLAVDSLEK